MNSEKNHKNLLLVIPLELCELLLTLSFLVSPHLMNKTPVKALQKVFWQLERTFGLLVALVARDAVAKEAVATDFRNKSFFLINLL